MASFDVFLSYSHYDKEQVETIAQLLARRGLSTFLDRWYLAPGLRWRPRLEEILASCRAVAVCVGPGNMGPWQQREVDVALDRQSQDDQFPVVPLLLPGCEPPLGFLRQLTWVDLRTQTLEQGVSILAQAIRGESPSPELQQQIAATRAAMCPYRGLLHFREGDAPFFFGRDAAIDQLIEAVERRSFLAVVGTSGSGKTSVVLAGLIPRLRHSRTPLWEIAVLVPSDHPLKSLAAALIPFLEPQMTEAERLAEVGKLSACFAAGTVSLADTIRRILEKQSETGRLLLVVDQWEELYALTQDDALRRKFVDELLHASTWPPVRVLLTLRGDFVGKTLAYRPLSDRLQDAQINLGPMTPSELRQAMTKPAGQMDLSFESGLVERILADAGTEPGTLPLLEFVLKELWENRKDRTLLNQAYDDMDKLSGAVAKRAKRFFEALTAPEQEAVRSLFLQLVRQDEHGSDIRRRELFKNIPDTSHPLIRKLADERFLVTARSQETSDETVEVAHESLIHNWDQLKGWLNADREFLLWRERLRGLLSEWQRAKNDQQLLLRGPLLVEARKWQSERAHYLAPSEEEFILLSARTDEQQREEECRRQRREYDRQKRHKRILMALTVVAALAAIVTVIVAIIAFDQKRTANQRLVETNWLLARQAQGTPVGATETSPIKATHYLLRAADAAHSASDSVGMHNAVLAANAQGVSILSTLLHQGRVSGAQFSADEQRILTWSTDKTARLWNANDGTPAGRPMKHEDWVNGAQFSANGEWILTWSRDGTARLWNAADGTALALPMKHQDWVGGARFSADGRRILTWSNDKTARVWNAADGMPAGGSMEHDSRVSGARFSGGDRWILTWSDDGTARVWNSPDGTPAGPPMKHGGLVDGAQFSADGQRILTWSTDGTALLWNTIGGMAVGRPMRHGNWVNGAQFSADGQRILTWSNDGTARLWNAGDCTAASAPMKHGDWVGGARFSADGQRILTWSHDGTARLWNAIDGTAASQSMKHERSVGGAMFSPDEKRILTWSNDGTARLWNATDGTPAGPPMKHESRVDGAQFSADGQRILTWSNDKTARLWKVSDGVAVGQPMRHERAVGDAHFSPDGQWVLTRSGSLNGDGRRILTWRGNLIGGSGEVRLWNATDGTAAGRLMKPEHPVDGAQFSPDGHQILTWSDDGTAQLWSVTNGAAVGQPMKHERRVNGVQFSENGQWILTWSRDGTARLWNATDGTATARPMKHQDWVGGARFSADEQRILTWSNDKTARLWNAADGTPLGQPMEHEDRVDGAQFSVDGRRILTWTGNSIGSSAEARLWNATDGTPSGQPMKHEDRVNGAQFSADGQRILTWSNDRTARLWSAIDGTAASQSMIHEDWVNGAQFSMDGRRILTWSNDKTARLWNATDGTAAGQPMEHKDWVAGAQFSADGQRILTWGTDGTVRLWNAADGTAAGQLMNHDDWVAGARFSAKGKRILTWSDDGTARLWNAANSQCMVLFRHTRAITEASFGRDETRVLTASADGTAQLWDISLDDRVPLDERSLEFEVRSATALGNDGEVHVLTTREWDNRRRTLLTMEIKSYLALTPSGAVRSLTPEDVAAKQRQVDEIEQNRRER